MAQISNIKFLVRFVKCALASDFIFYFFLYYLFFSLFFIIFLYYPFDIFANKVEPSCYICKRVCIYFFFFFNIKKILIKPITDIANIIATAFVGNPICSFFSEFEVLSSFFIISSSSIVSSVSVVVLSLFNSVILLFLIFSSTIFCSLSSVFLFSEVN